MNTLKAPHKAPLHCAPTLPTIEAWGDDEAPHYAQGRTMGDDAQDVMCEDYDFMIQIDGL